MISDINKKKTLSKQEIVCKRIFSQMRGLMFRKKQNLIMEFPKERRISLHNCFVFFTTDVLILDSEKRIVEIKRNLRPFHFWSALQKGKYVIELGLPENRGYDVGDRINFS